MSYNFGAWGEDKDSTIKGGRVNEEKWRVETKRIPTFKCHLYKLTSSDVLSIQVHINMWKWQKNHSCLWTSARTASPHRRKQKEKETDNDKWGKFKEMKKEWQYCWIIQIWSNWKWASWSFTISKIFWALTLMQIHTSSYNTTPKIHKEDFLLSNYDACGNTATTWLIEKATKKPR